MLAAFLMRSGSELRTGGPNERMHSHLQGGSGRGRVPEPE